MNPFLRAANPGMMGLQGRPAPQAAPAGGGYGQAAPGGPNPGMFAGGGMAGRAAPTPNAQKVPQPGSLGALFGGGGRAPAPARPNTLQGMFGGGGAPPQQRPNALASMFGGGGRAPQQQPAGGGFAGLIGRQQGQLPSRGNMGASMGALMSDERSKRRIQELEHELDRTYSALEGTHAEYPTPGPHHLDEAYRAPGSYSYEYKDDDAPGAAPGRHVGPMAQELHGIPGVVSRGPDGMERVDAGRLTMANTSQLGEQRRELDALNERLRALGDDPDAVLEAASSGGRARR